MFKITYRPKYDRDHSQKEYITDIKDIGNFILELLDNKKEANYAMRWCGEAKFGSKLIRQPNYKIECFNEKDLIAQVEKEVIKPICKRTGISCIYKQFDKVFIWQIQGIDGEISYHEQGGYNAVVYDNNNNVCNILNSKADLFIRATVRAMTSLPQFNANRKSDNTWHKMYYSGKGIKQNANDSIDYYYKNSGERIVLSYLDWRHKKPVCYAAIDKTGKRLGSYNRLCDAQKAFYSR